MSEDDLVWPRLTLSFLRQDNWVRAGRPEPRTTSRFDTRVDYIFSSHTFNTQWRLQHFRHVPYDASDHSLVLAEFTKM